MPQRKSKGKEIQKSTPKQPSTAQTDMAAIAGQEQAKPNDMPNELQKIVAALTNAPEILMAIKNLPHVQKAQNSLLGSFKQEDTGKISQTESSKTEKGSSSKNSLSQNDSQNFLSQNVFPDTLLSQNVFSEEIFPNSVFSDSQIILSQSKISKQNCSEYTIKKNFQNILTIEDGFYDKDPLVAVSKVFSPGWHFKPWDVTKTQRYYMAILETTGSATFKHHYLKTQNTQPSYSTCKIIKIIHPKDWGQQLHHARSFPSDFQNSTNHCQTFTYWDYQQAWYNAFLFQNQKNSHSWLIHIQVELDVSQVPSWFIHWWNTFGPVPDILRMKTWEGFNHFRNHYKPTEAEEKFPMLFLFCSKFWIPWICVWYYEYQSQNNMIILTRKYKVRWWDSFKCSDKSSKTAVQEWLQKAGKIEQKPTSFLFEKAQAQALLTAAKTKKEYYETLEEILRTKPESPLADSDSEEPMIDLGDENGDDCYGIFSPIPHK